MYKKLVAQNLSLYWLNYVVACGTKGSFLYFTKGIAIYTKTHSNMYIDLDILWNKCGNNSNNKFFRNLTIINIRGELSSYCMYWVKCWLHQIIFFFRLMWLCEWRGKKQFLVNGSFNVLWMLFNRYRIKVW